MFRIGAVADVQYADRVDKPPRFYRASVEKFRAALTYFNSQDLRFVVHLGDLIDRGWHNFGPVLEAARLSRFPIRYVLGNHDLKVGDTRKRQVPDLLSMPARYYEFRVENWVFAVLDGTEVSAFAWPEDCAEYDAALRIRKTYPPAKAGNGGIGAEQRDWLDQLLTRADHAGQKVAMLCHYPVTTAAHAPAMLLNAAEMRRLIAGHASARLWLNGHWHDGGYVRDGHVHHLNLRGMVETGETAAAVLDFHDDRILVHGLGREPSRELLLTP